MKRLVGSLLFAISCLAITAAVINPASSQLIYGNTFPFWNVNGPLTVTGTTTLSGGLVTAGTTTNDSAAAGMIGEFATSTVSAASAIAGAATTVPKDITTLALTAGDWEVFGRCYQVWTGVTATVKNCSISSASATLNTQAGGVGIGTNPLAVHIGTFGTTLSGTDSIPVGPVRVSLSAAATMYLVHAMTYSAGSYTQYGAISARRIR